MAWKSTRGRSEEFRRILCPTDFSSSADEAMERAAHLAKRDGAELVLVHVLPPVTAYVVPDISGSMLLGFSEEWRTDAWQRLCSLRDRIRQSGVVIHAILREGYPADEIARVAGRLRCDLIVLGIRGETGLFNILFGRRVAEGVMRRAPCPILAYRSPQSSPAHGYVKSPLRIAA